MGEKEREREREKRRLAQQTRTNPIIEDYGAVTESRCQYTLDELDILSGWI